MVQRCDWAVSSQMYIDYHDQEWGSPVHDDRRLFEMLVLEGAQAGLSWSLILKKRAAYREALDGFDPRAVAGYGEAKIAELLANPGIIRNRLKITAFIRNARAFLETQAQHGSFDRYLWQFVDGTPRVNTFQSLAEIPARTPESDAMSKDLRQRGFTFAGSTICYAYMQSVGMVNDHLVSCFRWREVQAE